MADKQSILADDIGPIERFDVPELGGEIYVRGMSSSDYDSYESTLYTVEKDKTVTTHLEGARARLLVRCLCDKDGNRILSDDDADKLATKRHKLLRPLADAAQRLSGLTDAATEALAKNSDSAPAEGSGST